MAGRDSKDPEASRLRETLVRALLRDGTLHPGPVARAFRRVPRHQFVPDVDLDLVYRDTHVPTKLQGGEIVSSSSQPAIMAIMLEQLAVRQGQHVLEVGAGTGYNAALLAEIVGQLGQVTSIDIDADTVERARGALCRAGYGRVRVVRADGGAGFGEPGAYDRVIATVGMGDIPLALWSQLKTGGRLVMPLSMRGQMKSVAFRKDRRGYLVSTSISSANFMPFRGAAPLLLREVRLGPELGLWAWSADRDLDTDTLYATLQRHDFVDIASDLRVRRRALGGSLNLWLRAHLPGLVQIHAEGALADTSQVPAFTRSFWAHPSQRDRLTAGLYQSGELALFVAISEDADVLQLGVRVWGGRQLGSQLLDCVRAWREAGSPGDEQLHLRLIPHGGRVRGQATIPMSAGTLEFTWRQRDSS